MWCLIEGLLPLGGDDDDAMIREWDFKTKGAHLLRIRLVTGGLYVIFEAESTESFVSAMNYNGHEESLTAREFDDSERWKILDYMTAQFQAPFREVREVKKKKAS